MTKEELSEQIDCIGRIISRDSKQIAENMNVTHLRSVTIKAEIEPDSIVTVEYGLERIADRRLLSIKSDIFGCHEGESRCMNT